MNAFGTKHAKHIEHVGRLGIPTAVGLWVLRAKGLGFGRMQPPYMILVVFAAKSTSKTSTVCPFLAKTLATSVAVVADPDPPGSTGSTSTRS